MSSYMQPSGSVREDRGPLGSPKSQLLLAALDDVDDSKSTPSWPIFGNEVVLREGERPDKAALRSRTNVPYLHMSIGAILEESEIFHLQKLLTGLLHVDGARSIGEIRKIPGISDREQRVNLTVSRLVDCLPEGVVRPSRRASLKSSQIANKSFDPASAMPSNVHISADVIGQSIKPYWYPAFTIALTLGSQKPQANTVFDPTSATAAPSSRLTDVKRDYSHSLPITKPNPNISACETMEDGVGTQKKGTEGTCNRQVERDENDWDAVVLYDTQGTYSIYSKGEAGRTQRSCGGDQRTAMNQRFYGAAGLSKLNERYGLQGVKRKRAPVRSSEAVVVASRNLLEEVREGSLYPKGKKRKGGLSG